MRKCKWTLLCGVNSFVCDVETDFFLMFWIFWRFIPCALHCGPANSTHGMILFINLVSTHHLRSCSINMTALIPSLLVLSYLRLADKRSAWVWSSWWKKIEETKPMTSLAATFWSPSIWLPPNITWADFEERSDFAQFHHLLVPFPLALILVLLRLIFEQGVFRPLGSWLGIASPPR